MVRTIVTGHGKFPTGLISSMELIAGAQKNVIGVDFLEEDTTESLEKMIEEAINKLGDEVLVLSDLAGASPFRVDAGTSAIKIFEIKKREESVEEIDGI